MTHSRNRINHAVCDECWNERNPAREPLRIQDLGRNPVEEICCYCGHITSGGIYVQDDPENCPNCTYQENQK